MGGCRCYFRECHANYIKYPRLHFFRFPLKEPDRFKKWRMFANMERILEFSEVRRKNTSICARHFRIECFMNYKMERLTPNAVPTLMRLTNNQALDYELDVENGVLVTLETTKFKHLIPPANFEDPLFLENDKILLDTLSKLQSQQYTNLTDGMGYKESDNVEEYELILEKPVKSLVNSVEILETIQVTGPNSKRPREVYKEDSRDVDVSIKKSKIFNTTKNCTVRDETIALTSRSLQRDEIDFIDLSESENITELNHEEGHLLLTVDSFIDNNNIETEEDSVEIVEIQRDYSNLHQYLPTSDSNLTVVELNTQPQVESMSQISSQELQNQLSELKKKSEDFNVLKVKLSNLETENSELKEICKENEQIKKKLLSLKMEYNIIKRNLKENKNLNDKLQKYSEENKKLKAEAASIDILRAEIISRKQETKELKIILDTLKTSQKNEQELKNPHDLVNEQTKLNENKLKEEITTLNRKLELTQQQLKAAELKLKEVKNDLNSMTKENERLNLSHEKLQQSLNNIQDDFDTKQIEYVLLKSNYDSLQQKYSVLEEKFWKIQALQNQEATVSTSEKQASTAVTTPPISASALTKAQLFNGIKRYLSASMVSLLRMEMFGSSEREWKTDERQVAVDIFRLGETVYKYFTDEWRFRLPGLRDVRNWLNQSQEMLNDEEDL